jgi:hypothetical protein
MASMLYRRRVRSFVFVSLVSSLTLLPTIASAAIILDADFDQGSLVESQSFATGNIVQLVGRDNFNPGAWKWIYFSATGVSAQQITFRIDDDFATGGADLANHQMVYSYDQTNWAFFDNNVRTASQNRYSFWNSAAFSQDRVYVAYGLPYPYGRTVDHVTQLGANPWVSPTLSANPSLVLGQSPGGVDDLGRSILPHDLFGFRITDLAASTPKKKIALVGGVHANETLGNLTLESLVNFLVGDSLEAGVLRKVADFYVYPMVNPDGRFAGYNRSTVQAESLDPNRYWSPPNYGGLDDVEAVGEAMLADTSADVDYLIDFHSDVAGQTGHYGNVLPQWQSNPLWLNLLQLDPSIDTNNALLEDDTTAKFGRDQLGASFSITFETQFLPNENADRFQALGENWGLAFFRTFTMFGDLNLDGALTGQDWLLFVASAETDLSSFSLSEAYLHGDLNADLANDPIDFGLFKSAYENVHGPGSFAAMVASVPEPASAALAWIFFLLGRALPCVLCGDGTIEFSFKSKKYKSQSQS